MLDYAFLIITYTGGYLVVGIVIVLACLSFIVHKHPKLAVRLLLSTFGAASTVLILKIFFDVPRPEYAYYVESTPTFPSGHAALGVALYGFLFALIWKHEKHPLKNKSLIMLFILIVSIGASRIYLGVHYVPDVLVGGLIGLLWIKIALSKNRASSGPAQF